MDEGVTGGVVVEAVDEAAEEGVTVSEAGPAGSAGEDLAMLREALLAAYPEAVPELVAGESVGALLASLGAAREAWRRVAEVVAVGSGRPGSAPGGAATVPTVPAGSAPPVAVDVSGLPPTEKIRRGLASRR